MKSTILLALLLLTSVIYAQYNFYSGLNEFYENHPVPDGNSVEIESSEYNEMKRIELIWSPRLFAHGGDEGVAASAIIDYAENYVPNMSSYNPTWYNLGPAKEIDNNWGVGQMGRLCFDPQYNNTTNQTIYVASSFGGLWRTETNGQMWYPITDYLPFTAIADVAVSFQNSNYIFIGTGYADGRFEYMNTSNHVNALNTFGVYRSLDFGLNWESISDEFFITEFAHGGTIRRLIVNPDDHDQLFIASTVGVFRCNNATAPNPSWQKVLSLSNPAYNDFRGLALKPGNPDIVYASGRDIYKSIDGGETFSAISIFLPDIVINRINIATTPADPDRLFAYIIGFAPWEVKNKLYIYLYHETSGIWEKLYELVEPGLSDAISKGRMALAVSPFNPNEFYFGHTKVRGTPDYTTTNVSVQSPYLDTGFHADVHDLAFQPNLSNPDLFAATDGGVNIKDLPNDGVLGWSYLYNGLSVNTIWGFDDSDYDHNKIVIGNQDCGYNKITNYSNGDWEYISDGDGYGVKFDNSGIDRWFLRTKFGNQYETIYRYNYSGCSGEGAFRPELCYFNTQNYFVSCNLPLYNHPLSNNAFLGFEEIFKRLKPEPEPGDQWDEIWLQESDVYKTNFSNWRRQIQEIKIAESDPDYMYLITVGAQNEPFDFWAQATLLLKTTTGGINGDCNIDAFDVIEYPGYDPDPQTFFPIVSNFTIDPLDENRIWITYTGFIAEYKVYRSDDGGETWDNEDPNGTLANLPVNDIEYQYGTNDRLFIGTDAGVYIKDGPNADWEKFGNIPNVRVTRIKINYCANKLRAGTFGRGIWETNLPSGNMFCKKIQENLVWELDWSLKGDLVIEPGNTLTIKGNVNMPPDSKIIVKRGAKLIVDGGNITNGCGFMWKGIEVWGTTNQPQIPLYQGWVQVKNEGTIENSLMGIYTNKPDDYAEGWLLNYTGGIVQGTNANFINNKVAVQFFGYNFSPASGFTDCNFVTTDNYFGSQPPNYFAEVTGMNGLSFKNCDFRNDTETPYYQSGIYSNNAYIFVEGKCLGGVVPCNSWDNGLFRNLNYGIYAITSNYSKYTDIRHTDFSFCKRSVYISNTDGSRVTSCNFSMPDAGNDVKNFYGIYLNNSYDYHIEDNEIAGPNPSLSGIGIYINNSGEHWNQVYNNRCSWLNFGTMAYGLNRITSGLQMNTGLCIECNDYDNNKNDIVVNGLLNKGHGIAYNQGHMGPNDTLPAGNTFTQDFTGLLWHYKNTDGMAWVNYVYHADNQTNKELIPDPYYSIQTMSRQPSLNTTYNKTFACPSKLNTGGGGHERDGIETAEEQISQKEAQLTALVDGGNTLYMNLDVITSTPPEASAVYNELMGESPYLSDTVMKSAIYKENVLPSAMVRDVLVANPQSAKNAEIIEAIDERFDPMPEWMKEQVLQGVNTTGAKEALESELAKWESKRAEHFNNLYQHFRKDTINPQASADSLEMLLVEDNRLESKYRLAFLSIDQGAWSEAQAALNSIPSVFDLSPNQQAIHQDYLTLFFVLEQLNGDLPAEGSAQALQLELLAADDENFPGACARNLLFAAGLIEYEEPVILPEEGFKSSEANGDRSDKNTGKPEVLKVFPNPAGDYFIAEYNTDGYIGDVSLFVTDVTGKTLYTSQFSRNRDQVVINTEDWSSGVYQISLMVNGKIIISEKVTIK
jgi:hypothetical protein